MFVGICDALSVVVTSSVVVTNSVTGKLSGASVNSVITIVVGDLVVVDMVFVICVVGNLVEISSSSQVTEVKLKNFGIISGCSGNSSCGKIDHSVVLKLAMLGIR